MVISIRDEYCSPDIEVDILRLTAKQKLILFAIGNRELNGVEINRAIERATRLNNKLAEGSLYPSLHQLEEKLFVISDRRKEVRYRTWTRYYSLTPKGKAAIQEILDVQKRLLEGES